MQAYTIKQAFRLSGAATVMVLVVGAIASAFSARASATPSSSSPPSALPIPSSNPVSLIHTPLELNDKVVHWIQTSYSYDPTSRDPGNGVVITGDIWEQIGPDSLPTAFRAQYRLPDGTLLQEILQTRKEVIVIYGPAYAQARSPLYRGGTCDVARSPSNATDMAMLLPQFADVSALLGSVHRVGAVVSDSSSKPLPATPKSEFGAPTEIYGPDSLISRLTFRQLTNAPGITSAETIEVGAQARIRFDEIQDVDSSGAVLSTVWDAYGSLIVYEPKVAPESIFSASQALLGGCQI